MKHPKHFWENKENVFEESRKYTSRGEFNKKMHKAYMSANKNGWLDKMPWLSNRNVHTDRVDSVYKYYFVKENAIYIGRSINAKVRDYQHKTVENDSVYKFAKEHNAEIPKMEIIESGLTLSQGIEKEIFWEKYYRENGHNMINKAKCGSVGSLNSGKWSKAKCIQESKKYTKRIDFYLHSNPAYQKSLKNGWLDEMHWLTNSHKHFRGYWEIKENILEEAKKYKSKNEFKKNCPSAYDSARKLNILNEMKWECTQIQRKKGFWTYENLKIEASKYKNRTEFNNKCSAAYKKALEMKIMDDFFPKKKDV